MAKFRERTSVQSHFLLRMLWYGIHLSPLSKLCLLSHTDVRELPAYAFASNRDTCRVDAEFLIVYNRSLMVQTPW
jgi:hypothetical protein